MVLLWPPTLLHWLNPCIDIQLTLTLRQVLLVCKYQNDGFSHLPVIDDPVELLPGLVYPVPVRAVHDEDQPLGPSVVMPPQGTDFVLTTNILDTDFLLGLELFPDNITSTYPDIEFNIFVSDRLYIKAHCRYSVHRLPKLQLVKYGRLPRRVQPQHQYPHLLVPKHLGHDLPHDELRGLGAAGLLATCRVFNQAIRILSFYKTLHQQTYPQLKSAKSGVKN